MREREKKNLITLSSHEEAKQPPSGDHFTPFTKVLFFQCWLGEENTGDEEEEEEASSRFLFREGS